MSLVAAVVAKSSKGADPYAALVAIFLYQWRKCKDFIRPTTIEGESSPVSTSFPQPIALESQSPFLILVQRGWGHR